MGIVFGCDEAGQVWAADSAPEDDWRPLPSLWRVDCRYTGYCTVMVAAYEYDKVADAAYKAVDCPGDADIKIEAVREFKEVVSVELNPEAGSDQAISEEMSRMGVNER